MPETAKIRLAFTVQGQVQGVGFRPFVWRLANAENITGSVRNTSAGVRVEAQGEPLAVAAFEKRLLAELPPLARITRLDREELPPQASEASFVIGPSLGHGGQNVLASPDVGICGECLADIRDPRNPRFGYAFTNCTNCGPRFSITRAIPYDRQSTAMACFPLCAACAAEYANPGDRRFHAQPVACPECGPRLWFVEQGRSGTGPAAANTSRALERAGELILKGGILALKGLGGFQLACNAGDAAAVGKLRQRKNRPAKALAVMVGDLEAAAALAAIAPERARLLESPEKPIVLCPRLDSAGIVPEIAPDTKQIGLMLANTPLHALLLDWLHGHGLPRPALVMTSANPAGEPICLGNREALDRLGNLADGWLLHDRDILVRVDDSVAGFAAPLDKTSAGPEPFFIRRARGYVPKPVDLPLPRDSPCVLGVGGELKATFCLTRFNQAFPGQHIGDLKNPATLDFYRQALEHMLNLLETEPAAIVRDAHPDFLSSALALELAARWNLPVLTLQHHAAHAAAALAENACLEPALALCLDGAGYGLDGTIWGGELIFMDLGKAAWQRLGCLAPFPLPGGDAAIAAPWRIARALQWQSGSPAPAPHAERQAVAAVDEMLARGLNCPFTSSCGRLFDAVAAVLNICPSTLSYEGQAAMLLEKNALEWLEANPGVKPPPLGNFHAGQERGLASLDSAAIFASAQALLMGGHAPGAIAAAFHFALAGGFAAMCALEAEKMKVSKVALAGGVMQNSIMAALLPLFLRKAGLTPLAMRQVPPGDGGIALGQAVWGMCFLQKAAAEGMP